MKKLHSPRFHELELQQSLFLELLFADSIHPFPWQVPSHLEFSVSRVFCYTNPQESSGVSQTSKAFSGTTFVNPLGCLLGSRAHRLQRRPLAQVVVVAMVEEQLQFLQKQFIKYFL